MDRRLVALKRLLDVMDELRVKCPWDRKQTFESVPAAARRHAARNAWYVRRPGGAL